VFRDTVKVGTNLYAIVTMTRSSKVPPFSIYFNNHWAWKDDAKCDDYVSSLFIQPEAVEAFLWKARNLLGIKNNAK
jgi:hypothetical protein